jgi:hypothetical protein
VIAFTSNYPTIDDAAAADFRECIRFVASDKVDPRDFTKSKKDDPVAARTLQPGKRGLSRTWPQKH